jgi:hypothetical protein
LDACAKVGTATTKFLAIAMPGVFGRRTQAQVHRRGR